MEVENVRVEDHRNVNKNSSVADNMTKIEEECEEKKSSSSIKSKKSSNILSNFIQRTKLKKKNSFKCTRNLEQNLNFIRSSSSIGIRTEEEEMELNADNYEKYSEIKEDIRSKSLEEHEFDKCYHSVDSDNSVPNSLKSKRRFFRKLLKKHSPYEEKRKSLFEEIVTEKIIPEISVEKMLKNETQQTFLTDNIPTSYTSFGNPTLNSSLETSLQEVKDLASRLQDNESHLMKIFTSFITDPSLQKQLIDVLFQHSKLQWETERRTSCLANDMWLQQLEVGRAQERALQDTLTSLVKQNRQLQVENEVLFRKHERILRKLKNVSDSCPKNKCIDCDAQIERILKHNEELQFKLEAYQREIENLEQELHMVQKHNENLEQHLKHSVSHVQNLKLMFARSKTSYEVEIVSLNKDLQRNERVLKESLEAGTTLIIEYENIKRQLKNLPLAISWTKFGYNGNEITHIINHSKSLINEFAKEIITLHSELCLKTKDFEELHEKYVKLQETLQKSSVRLEETDKSRTEQTVFTSGTEINCHRSQAEIKCLQEEMETLKQRYEDEKIKLLKTISEYEKLDRELMEKNKLIEQTKLFISNMTSENIALRGQVDGLNKLLTETGAGDMVKELSLSQDQLYFYKSQYHQLLSEKQLLLEKQKLLDNDRQEMLSREDTNYRLFQKQIAELKNFETEYKLLLQRYETEHQTVLSLQNERMKYLEEKSMLKTIFNHMKAELSRIQKLEGTVLDISKEANKLALVAEYNQKLGCKLKNELYEKDKTIVQLKSSVEKLNDIQLQHTKDKLSLCYELSEICQIKDHLSQILTVEVQKNYALGDSKKELVHTATSEIRKYEELQKNDRLALKSVLKDLKSVSSLKNILQKDNEKLKDENAKLKAAEDEYKKKINDLILVKKEQELLINNMKTSDNTDKELLKKLEEKLALETDKYNTDLNQLKKLIIQLRGEKEELDSSVKYLQNNSKKLYNDLNEVRRCEKEMNDQMKKCLLEKQEVEFESISVRKKLEESNDEKDKLIAQINSLNSLSEKMLHSMEMSMKASVEKEELFREELDDTRRLIMNLTHDVDGLRKIIKEKEIKIAHLEKQSSVLKEKIKSSESLELENTELKNKNSKLETEFNELQTEYDNVKKHFEHTQQTVILLQNQLRALLEQKENDHQLYQQQLEEGNRKNQDMETEYKMEINNLKLLMKDLSERLENEKASYAALSQIHKEMSGKFIKSIKSIVDEKNARQEFANMAKKSQENVQTLTSEKVDLQNQVTMLLDAMAESNNRINILNEEKESLQKKLEDLHKRYNEILKKCLSLENQVLSTEIHSDRSEYDNLKQEILHFKNESLDNQNLIANLRNEITNLEHQITAHEFKKSELTLRLHEIQRKYETEQSLCEQLKNTHRLVLATVLQMRDDGKLDVPDSNNLIHMVQSCTNTSSDEY